MSPLVEDLCGWRFRPVRVHREKVDKGDNN
jgi:hypothetical protein